MATARKDYGATASEESRSSLDPELSRVSMSSHGVMTGKLEEASPLLVDDSKEMDVANNVSSETVEEDEDDELSSGSSSDTENLLNRHHHPHSLSNFDTLLHLLKGYIGSGVLAMPDGFKNGGLLVGPLLVAFMAVVCTHGMHLLVESAHILCRKRKLQSLSYPQVAELTLATSGPGLAKYSKLAKRVVQFFLCVTQLGFCCVYVIFCSQSLKLVMDHHFGSLDYHVYMLFLAVPTLLVCSIRNLKKLAPVSMFANAMIFLGLVLIFFYLFQDLPKTWERKWFSSWKQLPLFFGTTIYAFEGIGVVLPLENQMRSPRDLKGWNGIVNTAMVIVSALYIGVGFFGYLKYGDDVLGSVTLNLPVEQFLAQFIILIISLAIFLSYPIQFYVALEIMLPFFHAKFSHCSNIVVEFSLRYALILLTFVLAAAIPQLDLFISLIGAISSTSIALLAPVVIDTITHWPHMGPFKIRLVKNVFIFVVGFVGFLAGSFVSIENIINKLFL